MEKYRARRVEYQQVNDSLMSAEKRLGFLLTRESNLLQAVTLLEKKLSTMEGDLKEQETKKNRAIKMVKKIIRDLKAQKPDQEVSTEEELDLRLRLVKDKTNAAILEVIRLGDEHVELRPFIQGLFTQYNIQPPSQPLSRATSRPDTAHSHSMMDVMSSRGSMLSKRSVNDVRNAVGSKRSLAASTVSMEFEGSDSDDNSVVSRSNVHFDPSLDFAGSNNTSRSGSRANLSRASRGAASKNESPTGSTYVKNYGPNEVSQFAFPSSIIKSTSSVDGQLSPLGPMDKAREETKTVILEGKSQADRVVRIGRAASAASTSSSTSSKH
jgi:sulfur relay (sulfurtransferase) DsrC/TusE family protein